MIAVLDPMQFRDRVRHLVLAFAPWWDEQAERKRRRKVHAAHLRAIRVRKDVERVSLIDDIAERYRRQDGVWRRP